MRASHQEALCSDGVRAPPGCDHMVIPHGEVVLDGCNASGSAGAHAVTLPHGRHGLRARRMAVLETCRVPSLCRQGHHEFMCNGVLELTSIVPVTACHHSNDIEPYSR